MSVARLDAAALRAHLEAGWRILDVREPPMYAERHVRGALNVAMANRAAPYWLQTLVPADARIAAVTATEHEAALVEQLFAVAERTVVGFAPFDESAFAAAGIEVRSTRTLAPPDAAAERGRLTVVDVREEREWVSGHVPGALWVPLAELAARAGEIPAGPVATICQSGFRSSIGASILESAGRDDLANIWGGTSAWMMLGLPVRRGKGA